MPVSRRLVLRALAGGVVAAGTPVVSAQDLTFVRIGTGGTGGTYLPFGGLIASAISNPPGSRDCDVGGSCGVPGLIANAVSSQGSVDNVKAVAAGQLEMGLSQADVAYYAYVGRGVFSGEPPRNTLRAVANLFPETLHLVARRDSGIRSVGDLRGRRVSLGERASGTIVVARVVLDGYGVSERDLSAVYDKIDKSSLALVDGSLDGVFMVGGYPIAAITQAADSVDIVLIAVDGAPASAIIASHPFLVPTVIPADTYRGVAEVATLSVGAQLIVSAAMDTDLVHGIVRALWHPNNRRLFVEGHPNGARMRPEAALDGVAIPLHPGAERYYAEVGLTRAGVF